MKKPLIISIDQVYTGTSKNVKYERNCKRCGKYYLGWGREFCSKHCRIMPKDEQSPSWKGDNITKQTGRYRAQKMYPLEPCDICGSKKSERHHVDSNPINNARNNIRFLCRKHHIMVEDRLVKLMAGRRKSSI